MKAQSRLIGLDALRGLAAIVVMLGHYTNRIHEVYPELPDTILRIDTHSCGARLLFMLSGFVVFSSWERGKNSLEFAKSRLSRLFPAFWVAVLFTFTVVRLFDLPGREVSISHMLVNLTMLPKFFDRLCVDGVYWTLQIQFFFFATLFLISLAGLKKKIDTILICWLVVSMAYIVGLHHIDVLRDYYVVKLREMFNFAYVWVFACGIFLARWQQTQKWHYLALTGFALVIGDLWVGWVDALLSVGMCLLLWLACNDRLTFLHHKALLYLASISYCLYLVHQNFGYVVIRSVVAKGGDIHLAIGVAIAASVAVSMAMTRYVEQPVAKWFKGRKPAPVAVAAETPAPTPLTTAVHYHSGRRHLELG